MANERQKRLMQEALDARLSPEAYRELRNRLDVDAESSAEFDSLKKLDSMLRNAPHEHAPQRLALGIMAKIAEAVKQYKVSSVSGLALALGLALVVLVTLPLLVAAMTVFLSAVGSAAALSSAIQQIVGLIALVLGMLEVFVQGAQSLVASYPTAPALLLAAVPIILFWLLRYMQKNGKRPPEEEGS